MCGPFILPFCKDFGIPLKNKQTNIIIREKGMYMSNSKNKSNIHYISIVYTKLRNKIVISPEELLGKLELSNLRAYTFFLTHSLDQRTGLSNWPVLGIGPCSTSRGPLRGPESLLHLAIEPEGESLPCSALSHNGDFLNVTTIPAAFPPAWHRRVIGWRRSFCSS